MKHTVKPTIYGLHHNAWRCSDAERTRRFYEDFLGLPLADVIPIEYSQTGRPVQALHLFFRMHDGSNLAFFDVPGMPFEFKKQHDFDLHIALRVDTDELEPMFERALAAQIEVRGVIDHGSIHSIYLRDPDGYVVELTTPATPKPSKPDPAGPRRALDTWQNNKAAFARIEAAASAAVSPKERGLFCDGCAG